MIAWKNQVASGKHEDAQAGIKKHMNLINHLFVEANPIPVKKAMQLMGLIDSAELRLPLVELGVEHTEKLKAEMKKVGVLA